MAIDTAGDLLAHFSASLPAAEQQTPDQWWQATIGVLTRLTAALPAHQPVAISVDGTSGTLLLCNSQNDPLSMPLMYNDASAREQADRLSDIAPTDAPVHSPTSSLAKLLLLLDTANTAGDTRAIHQAEWILAKLAGRILPGDENNCLKLGYDPILRQWPEWLIKLDLPAGLLPPVVPAGHLLGVISSDIATLLNLPNDCQIVAGTTDSTAAALATGISEPGQAATSLGSSLVLKILTEQPLFSSKTGVYSHRIFDYWLTGGASNSGGAVLRKYFSDQEMTALTPKLNPDQATSLNYYPLLQPGERFPYNDPDYPVRITPIPKNRALFFQGLLEGIANIERMGYAYLQHMGAPAISKVITCGGGSINPAWQKIRSKLLNVPVVNAVHTEAAYGTALLARTAITR